LNAHQQSVRPVLDEEHPFGIERFDESRQLFAGSEKSHFSFDREQFVVDPIKR